MKSILSLASALTLIFSSTAMYAATIHVTKYTDSFDGLCNADCSLREAIQIANATPEADKITLNSGIYLLEIPTSARDEDYEYLDEDENIDGDLDITNDLIIEGVKGETTIKAASNDRIFEIISGNVELANLILTGGWQREYGGAIENHTNLLLKHSTVTNNLSSSAFLHGSGGGIANWGTLTIYASKIMNNRSSAGEPYRGEGGGIYNAGTLNIRDSTIQGNSANDDNESGQGAGLFNTGTADIRRSLFAKNSLSSYGFGSAIMNANNGVVKLVSSTISNNSSGDINGAAAIANGSPYYSAGKLSLTNITIADNSGYGLYTQGNTYIRNSIIAGNARDEDGLSQNCYRVGGNYEMHDLLLGKGENPDCWFTHSIKNNKTFTTLLMPLSDHGGATLTHMLRPGSIAIDASQEGLCPAHDQRGYPTDQDGNADGIAQCDLGAVEYHP